MNHALNTTAIRIAGAAALALATCTAFAQTQTIHVDALAQCVNVFSPESAPAPLVLRDILPGSYSIKVKSSTVDFCGGMSCPHPNVALTIYAVPYVADTFIIGTKATKLTFTDSANFLGFYFPDSNCGDNIGESVVQLTKLD
jgi:hypothetical protein